MSDSPSKLRRVLVIEDSESDYMLLSLYLARANDDVKYDLERTDNLADGIRLLTTQKFHIALVDLGLPDSWGLATLDGLLAESPDFPLIVLTGLDDECVGVDAVKRGAADFLPKGRIDTDLLVRTISHARVRHKIQKRLAQALHDAQATEANLHNLISSHADGILVVDSAGAILFANQSASDMYGRPFTELRGCRSGLPIKTDGSTEFEIPKPDGSSTPVEMRMVEVQWERESAHLAMLHNLTARRRAERERAQLQQTQESLKGVEQEIEIARKVQESLFPDEIPSVAGFDMAAAAFTAEFACGDYYDLLQLPDGRVAIAVGDVSGHGLGPAMMMVQTRASLRSILMFPNPNVGDALTRVNELLSQAFTGRFVSMFFGLIDPKSRTLQFASAGQQGYLVAADGTTRCLEPTGPVLGVIAGKKIDSAPEIKLLRGDILIIPTDGIEEAHSPDEKMFGRDRMLQFVRDNAHLSAKDIVHGLHRVVCDFTSGPQADDITALVVKVK